MHLPNSSTISKGIVAYIFLSLYSMLYNGSNLKPCFIGAVRWGAFKMSLRNFQLVSKQVIIDRCLADEGSGKKRQMFLLTVYSWIPGKHKILPFQSRHVCVFSIERRRKNIFVTNFPLVCCILISTAQCFVKLFVF